MSNIFISYRRDDSSGYAGRLYDRLAAHFSEERIFMDIDTLEPGVNFAREIEQAVGSCDVLIALIGKVWLSIIDRDGQRRLDNPKDWVRLEIATALQRDIRVIPVLVQGAVMPSEEALPDPLQKLAQLHAFDISDRRFHADVDELIGVIERAMEQASQPPERKRLPFEPETVLIPSGLFLMGSDRSKDPNANDDELPQHPVMLPDYWIGKYQVTVGEYQVFIEAGGYEEQSWWSAKGWAWRKSKKQTRPWLWEHVKWTGDDRLPVVGVSWFEVNAYCRWLADATGQGYRLPTEAEWEKAARGTDSLIYPWGNRWREGLCNWKGATLRRTTLVGSYSPAGDSPYGVADMAGNVWEWTSTLYRPYPYSPVDGRENVEDAESPRVLRGGSWDDMSSLNLRTVTRNMLPPSNQYFNIGFRCALSS